MDFHLCYFKSEMMILLKCYTQYVRKSGKFSNGHRTGKIQFSFQSQSKTMPVFKLPCDCAISHTNEVTPKILPARQQQYVNWGLPDIKVEFRKGRETRNQTAKIHWFIEKAREFQKNIYFCFINYTKAFDCLDHQKLWKILTVGSTRPPYMSTEKSVCGPRSNS